jgi:hypothetical protein
MRVGWGHNREKLYLHMFILKKIFSGIRMPISIKLGINDPWVKGILNSSNKGPGPLQRGDNCKNGVWSFKIFSRTTEPE